MIFKFKENVTADNLKLTDRIIFLYEIYQYFFIMNLTNQIKMHHHTLHPFDLRQTTPSIYHDHHHNHSGNHKEKSG